MEKAEREAGVSEGALATSAMGIGAGIVYCGTKKMTESMAKALQEVGVAAEYYHASLSETLKQQHAHANQVSMPAPLSMYWPREAVAGWRWNV